MWNKNDAASYKGNSFSDPEAVQLRLRQIISQYMAVDAALQYDEMRLPAEDRAILDRADSYIFISFAGQLLEDFDRCTTNLIKNYARMMCFRCCA